MRTIRVTMAFLLAIIFSVNINAEEKTASSMEISGSILLCLNETGSYTLQNAPSGNIVWSVSEGLTLLSGQGTKTITVQSKGTINYSTITVAVVSSPNIYSQNLEVRSNTPYIESITGPSSPVPQGTYEFNAYPTFDPAFCDYEWLIGGGSYSINYQNRGFISINFLNSGSYNIGCRTKNTCSSGIAGTSPLFVTLVIGNRYSAMYNPSTQAISINATDESTGNSTVNCELYNVQSGALTVKKEVQEKGGSIDATSLPKGIYILKIGEQKETFKLQIQ